jgi:hypothetical protein
LVQASRLAGLDLHVTGALGKRTKYQENDFAQLTLDVDRKNDVVVESASASVATTLMPLDVKLNDEVRLEHIKFKDDSRQAVAGLSLAEQSIILGNFFLQKRSKPRDSLTAEELGPYLDLLLRQPTTCWCQSYTTSSLTKKLL